MRRRLDLAMSLVGEPVVLFLDEPTTGLDPGSRQAMWQLLDELVGRGVSVLLTTQYLEEADRLADRIAVLAAGRIVAEGTPEELKQDVGERRLILTLADRTAFGEVAAAARMPAGHLDADRLRIELPTDGSAAQVRALLDDLDPDRCRVARFEVHTPTLDDVFLALTGQAGKPGPPECECTSGLPPSKSSRTEVQHV